MVKPLVLIFLLFPCLLSAQIGVKAGLNFANFTKSGDFSNSTRSGFHAGIFVTPNATKVIGFNAELLYSRQGYNFKDKNNTGTVNLDYIVIPTFLSLNFTRYLSIMGGLNFAYLFDGKVDTIPSSTGGTSVIKFKDYYKKLDFGLGLGAESHPVGGLVIGARFNFSLGNLFNYVNDAGSVKEAFCQKSMARIIYFRSTPGGYLAGIGSTSDIDSMSADLQIKKRPPVK
ncbi:MAG: PorT family protein [Saprospiraceae bacterium]|nr:PorT family protein [Saprospiraceae bacterium]